MPTKTPFRWAASVLLACLCLDHAAAQTAPKDPIQLRERALSSAGMFVPVNLDRHAGDAMKMPFPSREVMVGAVPFQLAAGANGADNLFLKAANWSDWQKDPSSYYAPYDSGAVPGDPGRFIFQVPVADYQAVYLLAAAEDAETFSNVVSFRIGAIDGSRRTTMHDFSAEIPRFSGKRNAIALQEIPRADGRKVFLVRVPLGKAIAQDFKEEWALDVDVTKELRLSLRRPDPNRYQIRPLGLPSGVHIFGMTFQRSPVQMTVTSPHSGHIFNQPEAPTFHIALRNADRRKYPVVIEAEATSYDGEVTLVKSGEIMMEPGASVVQDLAVPVTKRGWYALKVRVKQNGKTEVLRRETSFALLAPDTRKFREESPFGTWDFCGGHFTSDDADAVGPLYVKAGLRYGMFSFPAEKLRKYGILNGSEPRSAELLTKKLEADPLTPKRILIFHEHAVSGPHIMRTPDLFTGAKPYQLDAQEAVKMNTLWQQAFDTARQARFQHPDAFLMFGNGNPHLLEEFLRRGLPSEWFDARGNEAGVFMRMPETQPLDFISNNAGLWMDRQILDHYGYKDKPITQCYEITYPGSNPGNLSERTQAAYFIRHAMHSLVWKIPVIRQGIIADVGNSYYFSNWGSSGFCHAHPEMNPKPAYVALATMTQVLDGAAFAESLPTGSPTSYALRFKKKSGGEVLVLWTLRGSRPVSLSGAEGTLIDAMGNESALTFTEGKAEVKIGPAPVFVTTKQPVTAVCAGAAQLAARPTGKGVSLLSPLNKLADWKVQTEADPVLEVYNFENPRRRGNFQFADVAEFEGQKGAISVKPGAAQGSEFVPMYTALSHVTGIKVPGKPTEIGLMVNGNGGWGRIIFELEDAKGQTWTSIGAAQAGEPPRWMADWMSEAELARMGPQASGDWNTNDPWQRSRVNFEGWSYVKFPMPGNYPGEGYHWPYSSQWRHTGDGVVNYPLRFKRLIVEMPAKMLYLKDYGPVTLPEIYLKDLVVTERPLTEAFVAE